MKKPAKPKMITRKGWVARGEMRIPISSFYATKLDAVACNGWYRTKGIYRAMLIVEVEAEP